MAERELGYIDTYGREEGDKIDHYPGALAEAERAAKNAHLEGLNAEQAQVGMLRLAEMNHRMTFATRLPAVLPTFYIAMVQTTRTILC